MKNVPSIIDGIEFLVNGDVTVTSKEISEKFGKDHKNVLAAIRNSDAGNDFNQLNFKPIEIKDGRKTEIIINKKTIFSWIFYGCLPKCTEIGDDTCEGNPCVCQIPDSLMC